MPKLNGLRGYSEPTQYMGSPDSRIRLGLSRSYWSLLVLGSHVGSHDRPRTSIDPASKISGRAALTSKS